MSITVSNNFKFNNNNNNLYIFRIIPRHSDPNQDHSNEY